MPKLETRGHLAAALALALLVAVLAAPGVPAQTSAGSATLVDFDGVVARVDTARSRIVLAAPAAPRILKITPRTQFANTHPGLDVLAQSVAEGRRVRVSGTGRRVGNRIMVRTIATFAG